MMNSEKLYEELYIVIENMDTEEIEELRPEFERLAKLYPDDTDIKEIQERLDYYDNFMETEQFIDDLTPKLVERCHGSEFMARRMAEDIAQGGVIEASIILPKDEKIYNQMVKDLTSTFILLINNEYNKNDFTEKEWQAMAIDKAHKTAYSLMYGSEKAAV